MRNLLLILILPLLLIACGEKQDVHSDASAIETAEEIVIKPNPLEFDFKLLGIVDETNLLKADKIEIRKKGTNEITQIVENFNAEVQKNETVIVEDVNFDGYLDIRLMEYLPSGPNIPYLYWIFDPETKQFVQNEELKQITSPEVDVKNKQLLSHQRTDATRFGTKFYEYRNNELVLVKEEIRAYTTPIQYKWTIKELDNDIMIITKDEFVSVDSSDAIIINPIKEISNKETEIGK